MQVENTCGVILLYLKKTFVGVSAALILFANNPQTFADEVEIFGSEFEDNANVTPPVENNNPPVVEDTPQVETPAEPFVENAPQVETPAEPVVEDTPQVETPAEPVVETPQVETPAEPFVEDTPQVETPAEPVVEDTPQVETPPTEVFVPTSTNSVGDEEEDFGDSLNFDNIGDQNTRAENIAPTYPESNIDDRNSNVTVPRVNNTPTQTTETTPAAPQKQTKLKNLSQRFVQVAVDENYIYYLDKQSVSWKRVPYMNSEYMADVWIRMIERNPNTDDMPEDLANYVNDTNTDEIVLAREKGYQYMAEDIKVLRHKKYFLEHYYLRPQKEQIQFLSELEVVGHPQNTAAQRKYDPNNWEELIPGSMESILYYSIIQVIGKSKASEKGHMTFFDMVEEYARISIR